MPEFETTFFAGTKRERFPFSFEVSRNIVKG